MLEIEEKEYLLAIRWLLFYKMFASFIVYFVCESREKKMRFKINFYFPTGENLTQFFKPHYLSKFIFSIKL